MWDGKVTTWQLRDDDIIAKRNHRMALEVKMDVISPTYYNCFAVQLYVVASARDIINVLMTIDSTFTSNNFVQIHRRQVSNLYKLSALILAD